MTRADLIQAILTLDPEAKRLSKLKKAVLQERLDGLQQHPGCGRGAGADPKCEGCAACTDPAPIQAGPPAEPGVHEWKQMFDTPEANEHWSGPDSGRWCAICGDNVRNVAATLEAAPCAGRPADRTLTVKGIKTFRGMEGSGFNATLYEDGKSLGMVIDEGCGGSFLYRLKGGRTAKGWEKERELGRWARVKTQSGMEALDILIGDLVNKEEERRWLKRHTKKKTVIRLKGQGAGEWTTYNRAYTPEFAAWVREKHGDELVEIANERDLAVVA
jgi:hypothetical protein